MNNKNVRLIFLGVLVLGIVLTIGGVLAGASTYLVLDNDGLKFERDPQNEIVTQTISEDITRIDLDADYIDQLVISSGEEFSISYPSPVTHTYVDNETLHVVKEEEWKLRFTFFDIERLIIGLQDEQDKIHITIPKDKTLDTLDVYVSAGVVEVEDLSVESISIVSNYGDIDVNNVTAHDITLLGSSSDVEIKNLQAGWLDIASSVGLVAIKDSHIERITCDQSTGDFDIKDSVVMSGDIDITIGDVDIDLVGDMAAYTLRADVGVGSFSLNGDEIRTPTVIGEGENEIDINLNTGDVELEFSKE